MALARRFRPFPAANGLPVRAIACAVLSVMALAGCGGEDTGGEASVPAGILRELESDKSVTTDVNARAPAFARETLEGNTVRTQDFIGSKVVLLDFWSVFCQSCLEGIPFLQRLYRDYRESGLEIISINTDFFPPSRIVSFMKKTGLDLPFPLVHDRDQSLSRLFGVEALPVTVLIDSAGWIRMVHLGYRPADEKTIENRVARACRRIKDTIVTLQPVDGRTAYAPPEEDASVLEPGTSAPDFLADDVDGRQVSFADLRGDSPAVLFFWSLFCQPCREEFPALAEVSRAYAPKGLKSFAVNLDAERLLPAAEKYLRRNGGPLIPLFAGGSEDDAVAGSYGVRYTPSIFLLSSDGTVVFSATGEVSARDLGRRVQVLVAGAAGGAAGGE